MKRIGPSELFKLRWVAPRAGAWIETLIMIFSTPCIWSPPARGRGLKLDETYKAIQDGAVAPRAGAWIETGLLLRLCTGPPRRPPRGGVD